MFAHSHSDVRTKRRRKCGKSRLQSLPIGYQSRAPSTIVLSIQDRKLVGHRVLSFVKATERSCNLCNDTLSAMSTLRRRMLGDSSEDPSRDPSPAKDGEPVTVVPQKHLEYLKSKRRRRSTWIVFGLGGLFGVILAAFFAQHNDVINLEGLVDFNLVSLIDVIPAGIVKDAKDITVSSMSPSSA